MSDVNGITEITAGIPDNYAYRKETVISCYDLAARAYAREFLDELTNKPFDRFILDRFAAAIPEGEIVYEMGCGPGQNARYLKSEHNLAVRGLDASSGMVRVAGELHPDIPWEVGDMLRLDISSDSVRGIVAFYAIVHFTLKEVSRAFDEFLRVLKPGGILLFSFHVGSEIISVKNFLDTPGADADWVFFEVDDIVALLTRKRCEIEDVMLRYPYVGKEHPSKRCYVIVRKPAEFRAAGVNEMKNYDQIARKITIVLFLSQGLSSAGFIAAFTVNSLVAVSLTGRLAMAGVPSAVYVLGQACGATLSGFSVERIGRRRGLAIGQVIGAIGSAIAMFAVVNRSFPCFLTGLVLIGIARSAVDLSRFAAAEVHLPAKRGRAISNVVLGSTVGAVLGPLLVSPTGKLAAEAGYTELAGPYGVVFAVLVLAALLIIAGLRPDPRDIGRELAGIHPDLVPSRETRSLAEILRRPGVIVAMTTMIFAQMVMMVPMSITPVHMKMHQHTLTAVSLVISAHAVGMYAFSIISGRMTDTWGRGPVIILGSTVLIISCVMAAPSVAVLPMAAALFLLGLGWNFAYVAGSTLLADQLAPQERAKTQGFNDLLLNLASAGSQIGCGVVYAAGGFWVMGLTAAFMAAGPIAIVLWWKKVTAAQYSVSADS